MKTLDKENNFLGLAGKYSKLEKSKAVILKAPLEKSVSYGKGTKAGPMEIINASHYVEFYDDEMDRELCFELGIATLKGLNFAKLSHKKSLEKLEKVVSNLLEMDKFVVTLGGEHSLSSASILAYTNKYPNLSVLQFDAHSDLRDSYEGTKYSHASVMARVFEFNRNLVQVGIRAQCIEESKFIKENNINTFYMSKVRSGGYGSNWYQEVSDKLTENVYISFDVDGLDPSIVPSTGTPEPGGLFWDETMQLLKLVGKQHNIVGCDVVELAPSKNHPSSNFTCAKLVYKIINYAFQDKS